MNKLRLCAMAFCMSALSLIIIYWRLNIIPFGDNTVILWDMEWQFSAFMSWFGEVLRGKADFWYSLKGALGSSTIGLYAYYLASPLNLLLILFNEKTLPYGILILYILKVGLSAGTMEFYLFERRQDKLSVIFSMLYALSSFMVCFQYNTMWMDSYLLIPVIVLGLDRLMNNKSGAVYSIALGLCVLSNYYIGFMVCLFCVVYFIGKSVEKYINDKASYNLLKSFGRFALFSFIGGGLSGAVVFPGALTLMNSSSGRVLGLSDFIDFSLIINPLKEFKYLFAGAFDGEQGILGEYPMLYAGAVTVLLVLFYFVSKQIKRGEKIGYGIILLLLAVGMVFRGPFLIWHGFMMPSGCHGRFAFIWVFIVLVLAYEIIPEVKKENIKILSICAIPIVIGLILTAVVYGFRLSYILNVIFIALAIAVMVISSDESKFSKLAVPGLIALTVFELAYNGIKVYETQYTDLYVKNSEYITQLNTFEKLNQYTDKSNEDNYRQVILHGLGDCFNQGYLRNINGINMYASTESEATWNIYRTLGLGNVEWESEDEFDSFSSALAADLLAVRYVYDYYFIKYSDMESIASEGDVNLYFNEDALPMVYLVNQEATSIMSVEASEADNRCFDTLNSLYRALYGSEDADIYVIDEPDLDGLDEYEDYQKVKEMRVFRQPDGRYTDGNNIAVENRELLSATVKKCADCTEFVEIKNSKIKFAIENPTNDTMYACVAVPYEDNFRIKADGITVDGVPGMGGFLLTKVEPGRHEYVISYRTRGLAIGIICSLMCVGLLIITICMDKRSRGGE